MPNVCIEFYISVLICKVSKRGGGQGGKIPGTWTGG